MEKLFVCILILAAVSMVFGVLVWRIRIEREHAEKHRDTTGRIWDDFFKGLK